MSDTEKNNNLAFKYPVMEYFYTIQGEGYWSGTPAYFIRLAGCDVGCSWCDVKESWNADDHSKMSVAELTHEVLKSKALHIVITGGEPAMYDLTPLVIEMKSLGLRIHIETSGAHKLVGDWHWICLSPKKFKPPVESIYQKSNELKIIVVNKSDFKFAEEHAALVSDNCRLYLQPEWSKRDKITQLVIEYVKENPRWSISLQTHKYLNIP